jgi:hypothetical protein
MGDIYFGEFRLIVIQHIKEIEAQNPEYQSIEWFFIRYLKRIVKNANPPTTPGKMENSIRALVRFYVDMIEENSPLGERCRQINEQYRNAIREE